MCDGEIINMEQLDIAEKSFLTQPDDDDEDEGHGPTSRNSGAIGGAFNTANTILGAGVIALPYIMKVFGMLVGIFLTVFLACVT